MRGDGIDVQFASSDERNDLLAGTRIRTHAEEVHLLEHDPLQWQNAWFQRHANERDATTFPCHRHRVRGGIAPRRGIDREMSSLPFREFPHGLRSVCPGVVDDFEPHLGSRLETLTSSNKDHPGCPEETCDLGGQQTLGTGSDDGSDFAGTYANSLDGV